MNSNADLYHIVHLLILKPDSHHQLQIPNLIGSFGHIIRDPRQHPLKRIGLLVHPFNHLILFM